MFYKFLTKGGVIINRLFIAEVRKQLSIRKWTHNDLAKATGYSKGMINAFMTGVRDSEKVKTAIAKALNITL